LKTFLNGEKFDVEEVINLAKKFMFNFDFDSLIKEYQINSNSALTEYEIKYELCKPIENPSIICKREVSLDSLSSYGDFIHKIDCEEEVINTSLHEEGLQKRINNFENGNFSLILKTTKNTDTAVSKNIGQTSLSEKDNFEESINYEVDFDEFNVDSKINGHVIKLKGMTNLK
jgi:hypothetical protein